MSSQTMQLIKFAANSRKGLRYEQNEDSYLVLPEFNIFAVADGMGGHNGGAVASKTTVDFIVQRLGALDALPSIEQLAGIIDEANARVYKMAKEDGSLKGMGSTLSLLYFQESHGCFFHVGDSRIYRHLDFMAKQLTTDHTNEVEDLGRLTNKQKNSRGITRALGVRQNVKVDVVGFKHEEGAEYLIVSDGVSDVLATYEITNIVSDAEISFTKRIERLLDAVDAKSGSDDKTAIIIAP